MNPTEKVLLIDDEPRILLALHRALSTDFAVDVAVGAELGLRALAERGPFAVVVSDLKMPVLDGIQFMTQAKNLYPDTVRIMLTGQADLRAAIAAVNEGCVFRFLTKPCPATVLAQAIEAALEQHRLITGEQNLLRETLMGSIRLLMEVLGVTAPDLFNSSFRICRYVRLMAAAVGFRDLWQLEAAGILSQIGRIALPCPGGERRCSAPEQRANVPHLFEHHPSVAAALLKKVQRLETTAQIVSLQNKPFRQYDVESADVSAKLVDLGGQILHIAVDLDLLTAEGATFNGALAAMSAGEGEYNPDLLRALEDSGDPTAHWRLLTLPVAQLDTSMVLDQEVRACNDMQLATRGEHVTFPLLERLRVFAADIGIVEPIQVLAPEETHTGRTLQDPAELCEVRHARRLAERAGCFNSWGMEPSVGCENQCSME